MFQGSDLTGDLIVRLWPVKYDFNEHNVFVAGAIFSNDTLQAQTAFRYEIEKHNNSTQSGFKLDKYEKIIDVGNGYSLSKARKFACCIALSFCDKHYKRSVIPARYL